MSQPKAHRRNSGQRVSFASTTSSLKSSASNSPVTPSKSSLLTAKQPNRRPRVDSNPAPASAPLKMDRPQSMSEFSTLMDPSMPLFEDKRQTLSPERQSPDRTPGSSGHSRKKSSLSLAAGLMMNGEKSPQKRPNSRSSESEADSQAKSGEESLFYAYALKSDYLNASPYLLTFATPAVCAKWWSLVTQCYPQSTRPSTQLFVLSSEDMQKIQEDRRFSEIRNQWFYTSQDRSNCATPVIPLQAAGGQSITISTSSGPAYTSDLQSQQVSASSAVDSLSEKLDRLAGIVQSSAEQIHALSVAQSAGLQRMQEINESNSTQIKAIAESQAQLQALVDKNATQYIALTNTAFQSNEKIKEVLQTTASQIQSLSGTQSQLAQACRGMMNTMEKHGASISQLDSMATDMQAVQAGYMCSAMATRINPPPRKLNKKIRGVWYEYDNSADGHLPPSPESPKRTITNENTPAKAITNGTAPPKRDSALPRRATTDSTPSKNTTVSNTTPPKTTTSSNTTLPKKTTGSENTSPKTTSTPRKLTAAK